MKLSSRADYGTRALLDLADSWVNGPTVLRQIAERQQMPLLYLQRLIATLVAGGIIGSTRGTGVARCASRIVALVTFVPGCGTGVRHYGRLGVENT
ncbi:MAG: Rrf2 family transcriptional regulator [Dehalococcoidia bacterium]